MTAVNPDDRALIDAWLEHLKAARGRRIRTAEAYGLALVRLCEFLQGAPLAKASPAELEAFAGIWLHKRGVVARSRKPYVSALRGFYAWLAKTGGVRVNPAAQLEHPKTGKPLPRALSLRNAEKLMWAPDLATFVGVRDAAMLALLLCGARVSGVVQLNEGDVRNTEIGGQVRLVAHLVEKGGRERALPLSREADMMVRVYLDHEELKAMDRDVKGRDGRPDRVMFVSTRNTMVKAHEHRGEATRLRRQSLWRVVQRYGRKLGIPDQELHPHAFRHLFGTELAEGDVPLLMSQDLLGHEDPKSTQIYTAMALGRKLKAMDAAAPLAKIKSPMSALLARMPAATGPKAAPPGGSGEHKA
jgi:integrase/recombinase XerD